MIDARTVGAELRDTPVRHGDVADSKPVNRFAKRESCVKGSVDFGTCLASGTGHYHCRRTDIVNNGDRQGGAGTRDRIPSVIGDTRVVQSDNDGAGSEGPNRRGVDGAVDGTRAALEEGTGTTEADIGGCEGAAR